MAEVSSFDLSAINHSISELAQAQRQMSAQLDNVQGTVAQVSEEVKELSERFKVLMEDQKRLSALQQATTEIVRVRQEIDSKFGNYKVVRETMLGVLQATDLAIVKKNTISRVSEELMISAPKYWLAPCLVAVAAWIGNDRELADRAIAEAVKRDEERTALTMALICRRNNRVETCYEWLSIYFSKQDSANFSEGTFAYIDAYVNGVFGPDSKHLCDDYIDRWISEIKARNSSFEADQEKSWKEYCGKFSTDIGGYYPALRACAAEFDNINSYVGRISSAETIRDSFNNIVQAQVDQEELKKRIDKNLVDLINKYDAEEEPLRKMETYFEAVKKFEGDTQKAEAYLKAIEKEREEKTLDLVEQMAHAIDKDTNTPISQKKTAFSFLKNYIKKGVDTYLTENKGKFPEQITLTVNGWSGTTKDGNNINALYNSYDEHLQRKYQDEKARLESFNTNILLYIAIAIAAVGIIPCVMGMVGFGIVLFVAAAVLALYSVKVKSDRENKLASLASEYKNMSENGKNVIRNCIEQWNEIKGVVYRYNSNPTGKIVA